MATAEAIARRDIVPTHLAVAAMRDNGYKNAAYAVAELIDNSIQAGASVVEVLCADAEGLVEERARRRLDQLAVLDNGSAMDADVLQMALQFGNGTRLEEGKASGMGRFGMGLPSASISQCQRVEVWSWQDGPESALFSHIDVEEVRRGELHEVPEPTPREIPELWREAADDGSFQESGTLVVWSAIDRCLWRTSRALIENSEELIGRMYREWIAGEDVRIRLASFLVDAPGATQIDRDARPNDPLYLTAGTSTPEPWDDKPMFAPFPDPDSHEIPMKLGFRGEEHGVKIRFSMAKEEARESVQAGSLPHGRHAARNAGVSVVRAGRELELDPAWTNTYDPRERWWGVEVRFEPGLDELFGVSNNKQFARNLAEAAKMDTKALEKEHGSITKAMEYLEKEGDPVAPLLAVARKIQGQIDVMRRQIKAQAEGRRRRRHEEDSPEARATAAVRRRKEQGFRGQTDEDEEKPAEERKKELAEQLESQGHERKEAEALAGETVDHGLKYRIDTAPLEAGAFFSVQPRGGILLVTLNTEHPAYDLVLGAQDPSELPDSVDDLRESLRKAQEGLEMMLFAWARYEDEQGNVSSDLRRGAQTVRQDWGRMAETFLRQTQADG